MFDARGASRAAFDASPGAQTAVEFSDSAAVWRFGRFSENREAGSDGVAASQVNIFACGKRALPAVAVNASQLRRPKAAKPETGQLILANAFDESVGDENLARVFGQDENRNVAEFFFDEPIPRNHIGTRFFFVKVF